MMQRIVKQSARVFTSRVILRSTEYIRWPKPRCHHANKSKNLTKNLLTFGELTFHHAHALRVYQTETSTETPLLIRAFKCAPLHLRSQAMWGMVIRIMGSILQEEKTETAQEWTIDRLRYVSRAQAARFPDPAASNPAGTTRYVGGWLGTAMRSH